MSWELIIYVGILSLLLIIFKRKLKTQSIAFPLFYFSMVKTTFGIDSMKKIAKKFPRFLNIFSIMGIGIGFAGMAYISFEVIRNLIKIFISPSVTAGVALVLPIEAKGIFYVPLLYWIISIAVVVLIHEGGHGIIALLHKIPVKKTGLAVLGVIIPLIPAAFVEIDEKVLTKRPLKQQLAVFAAGPLFNIALAALLIPGFFLAAPYIDNLYTYQGVHVSDVLNGFDVADSNVIDTTIIQLNDQPIHTTEEFSAVLGALKPGDTVQVHTDTLVESVVLGHNPSNQALPYMGVIIEDVKTLTNPTFTNQSIIWFHGLYMWLIILNLGVGLFNLIPIGPIDGGRMLHATLMTYVKEKHALHLWKAVSMTLLIVVLGGVAANFVL